MRNLDDILNKRKINSRSPTPNQLPIKQDHDDLNG